MIAKVRVNNGDVGGGGVDVYYINNDDLKGIKR